jgi:hypothetical protein
MFSSSTWYGVRIFLKLLLGAMETTDLNTCSVISFTKRKVFCSSSVCLLVLIS